MCSVLVYFQYCHYVCAVFWCILSTVTTYVGCSGVFWVLSLCMCGVLVYFECCYDVNAVFLCIFLKNVFTRLHFYPVVELKNLVAILRVILYGGEICSIALRVDLGEGCLRRAAEGNIWSCEGPGDIEWKWWLHDLSVGALVIETFLQMEDHAKRNETERACSTHGNDQCRLGCGYKTIN
jgi:hypothetical protein